MASLCARFYCIFSQFCESSTFNVQLTEVLGFGRLAQCSIHVVTMTNYQWRWRSQFQLLGSFLHTRLRC